MEAGDVGEWCDPLHAVRRTSLPLDADYPFYEHPPHVALLISRTVVDPALPMMIID